MLRETGIQILLTSIHPVLSVLFILLPCYVYLVISGNVYFQARERHAELMKHKALLSYQEAKARWRNKIKSKRLI